MKIEEDSVYNWNLKILAKVRKYNILNFTLNYKCESIHTVPTCFFFFNTSNTHYKFYIFTNRGTDFITYLLHRERQTLGTLYINIINRIL